MLEHKEIVEVLKTSASKEMFKIKDKDTGRYYIESVIHNGYFEVYQTLQKLKIRIPRIIEVKQDGSDVIVIEEFLPFPTLEEYIRYEKLTVMDSYRIMCELCDILHVLHSQIPPIIHRDIKPNNIFYNGKNVFLADFDIARHYSGTKQKDTVVLGTVGYAAPEQYGLGQSGIQADIYSLGILFHYLLSGRFPYQKLYHGKETKIIERCIETVPENRYQDVLELKEAILHLTVYDHKLHFQQRSNRQETKKPRYDQPPHYQEQNTRQKAESPHYDQPPHYQEQNTRQKAESPHYDQPPHYQERNTWQEAEPLHYDHSPYDQEGNIWQAESLSKKKHKYLPVGLREFNPLMNILAEAVYGVIIWAVMYTYGNATPDVSYYETRYATSVFVLILFIGTIQFWGNYADIFDYCLFHKSHSKLLIFIGRLMTYFLLFLLYVIIGSIFI